MVSTMQDFFKTMDWELLRTQKEWLCNQRTQEADGLLILLDHLQDIAVLEEFATESEVFDI